MNRDEIKGKADVVKGKVKQTVSDVTDDPRLHDEGIADEAGGRARQAIGRTKRKVGEVIEDAGKALKR